MELLRRLYWLVVFFKREMQWLRRNQRQPGSPEWDKDHKLLLSALEAKLRAHGRHDAYLRGLSLGMLTHSDLSITDAIRYAEEILGDK